MIYTDFSVKNYRGIRQCKLEKLELINLFFGKNNCGKSSLLESLFILSGPDNPTLPILANLCPSGTWKERRLYLYGRYLAT